MLHYTRRQFLGTLGAAGASAAAAGSRPNILYIMADDHAAHAISAYGSRINRTPHIDRIAQGGVRLTNCFCTNSICTPSRAAILTGQYSHRNGVYTLNDRLDPSRNHVAKELQRAGYQTAMIGKWHLASDPTGFDYWNILPGQGVYYDPTFLEPGGQKQYKGYCTDLIGDFTLDWLKRRDPRKPFFVMSHHKAPHRPWEPSPKYKDLFAKEVIPEPDNLYDHYEGRARSVAAVTMRVGENMNQTDLKQALPPDLKGDALRKWAYQLYIKDYLRCIQSLDDNVGRMLDYLDSEGLAANTIVIYTSDQGFFLGDHGWFDKRLMYEESLRMPFLMRYPGAIRGGSVNRDMALNIDFAPLFLDYAGVKPPGEMQGRSFRACVEGHTPKDWRQAMYYRYWMHNDSDHHVPAHYGVRTARWKLIYYYGRPLGKSGANPPDSAPEWELYDMRNDPREMRNLYGDAKYASVARGMKAQLDRLQREAGDAPAEVTSPGPG
ncbi:MAG TPA: sulfatase [Bryobacteraceae bacterium]|nr:sulfatase [Bryobacteraceae bacterium]